MTGPTPFTCRNNFGVHILLAAQLFDALLVALDFLALSVWIRRNNGSSVSRNSPGIWSAAFPEKLTLEQPLQPLPPMVFTIPRTVLINFVRLLDLSQFANSPITRRSSRTSVLRSCIGYSDFESTRPSLASLAASIRSFLRRRRFLPSIRCALADQHFMSKAGDHFPYPRRMSSHFDNHTRNRQALKELANFLPPRTKLALAQGLAALEPKVSSRLH